jgi:hypothetical protein
MEAYKACLPEYREYSEATELVTGSGLAILLINTLAEPLA